MAMMEEPDAQTWRFDHWWVFLVTGIAWFIFSMAVLQFDIGSVSSISYVAGFIMLLAGINEFITLFLVKGWRWLRALMAVLFIVAGITALTWPGVTFLAIARILAWYLLFKGTFDIIAAFMVKGVFDIWWMGLISGILELMIAFWVVGYPGRSVTFLILWVGFSALTRGITEIILAFQLKGMRGTGGGPSTLPAT